MSGIIRLPTWRRQLEAREFEALGNDARHQRPISFGLGKLPDAGVDDGLQHGASRRVGANRLRITVPPLAVIRRMGAPA